MISKWNQQWFKRTFDQAGMLFILHAPFYEFISHSLEGRSSNIKIQLCLKKVMEFSNEVKHLVVILSNRLYWDSHLDYCAQKVKRRHGKMWAISPRLTYWIFTTIIKPIITYAARTWWTNVKLHRLVCRSITWAMKTCPTEALGVITTGILPLIILNSKWTLD